MHQLDVPRFEIPFSAIALSFFYLVGFLFLGCAPKPKILQQNRTPENVWRCALENRVKFETCACLLDLKLKGQEAKLSGTIEFYYEAPDRFAFYPRVFLGMDVFRATGDGDSLTIYLPKDNEYYSGSFSDLEKTRLWGWKIPLKILLDLILGKEDLAEPNIKYKGNSEDLFLYEFEDESWVKEYWIDARRCRLIKSQFISKSGKEFYRVEYKNYAAYDQVDIPKDVKIKSLTNDYAQIKFLERKFDFPIPENKFKLQIPPDAKRIDFESREK